VGKTYRIFRIFSHEGVQIVVLRNGKLFLYNSLGLIVEIILLVVWTAFDPLKPYTNETSDPTYALVICQSTHATFQTGMQWGLIGFNLAISVIGGYLAVRTRHVETNYKESKYIGLSIYNVFVMAMIVLCIEFAGGSSPTAQFLVLVFGILMVSCFTLLVLFLPKFLLTLNPDRVMERGGNSFLSNQGGSFLEKRSGGIVKQRSESELTNNVMKENKKEEEDPQFKPSANLEIALKELSGEPFKGF